MGGGRDENTRHTHDVHRVDVGVRLGVISRWSRTDTKVWGPRGVAAV